VTERAIPEPDTAIVGAATVMAPPVPSSEESADEVLQAENPTMSETASKLNKNHRFIFPSHFEPDLGRMPTFAP
jgi:hypothetical protein